jgi:hypothetical protein
VPTDWEELRGWWSAIVAAEKELVDIDCEIKGETDLAWRIAVGDILCWVPKSQVENNMNGTVTMPSWLAKDKGLI